MGIIRTLLLAAVCLSSVMAAAVGKPNVIIIVADDMGYADCGAYGGKDIPTPNIDALAAGGVRCTNGYVSGPYCSPTRAGLLTGRYQQRFGHEFNPGQAVADEALGLSVDETTLPQRLQSAGYETAMVGKWHLGNAPQFLPMKRGFDSFVGFLGGAHQYHQPRAGAATQRANRAKRAPVLDGGKELPEFPYLTELFGSRAAQFIQRDHDKPFFLYLAFNAVHTPLQATPAKLKQFEHIKDEKRRTYAAMLSSMDDAIGGVLASLREKNLEQDTLIFFISDNGGPEQANASDNGPLRGGKATTWEGGVRVPFIVQWKAQLPAGKTYDLPVIQLDILPTILAAVGVEPGSKDQLDGVDLVPFLSGKNSAAPHESLFWRFGAQMAIRHGDWKLVRAGNLRDENAADAQHGTKGAMLFNLKEDVGESTDLSAANPEIAKRLTTEWEAWNRQLKPPAWSPRRR